jgi:hypothetical protein
VTAEQIEAMIADVRKIAEGIEGNFPECARVLDVVTDRLRETANHEACVRALHAFWESCFGDDDERIVADNMVIHALRAEEALAATQPPAEEQPSRIKRELAVALKLYAKARKITIDEATENVRDAVDINTTEETDGKSHVD